jgi:2-C-methyl-D-erythritol 4-phosphate cytidylyltransferase/2-C-methyl-D-erythritol 2,4-cyclodiphosphate synthase
VVAAGAGRRLGGPVRKALVPVAGKPLVEHALRALLGAPWIAPIVVVAHPEDLDTLGRVLEGLPRPARLVEGGARRQDSVRAGLAALPDDTDLVLVHDAARPFVPVGALAALVEAAAEHGAAILAMPVADTIKSVGAGTSPTIDKTLPRDRLWAAQTPQAFRRSELLALLEAADENGVSVTDEAALYESDGRRVACVTGSRLNFKVTTADDLRLAEALLQGASGRTPSMPFSNLAIGMGSDVHRFKDGVPLVLGGVRIPSSRGLDAHSDGDVLMHAILDAVLSAAALDDLGTLFPDTDPENAGRSSVDMAHEVARRMKAAGAHVLSLDSVILAEEPRIAPVREQLRESIAAALEIDVSRVNVKGKTFESLGPIGRREGIEVRAVALVERRPPSA